MPNEQTNKIDFHALVIATGASIRSPLVGLNADETFYNQAGRVFEKAWLKQRPLLSGAVIL